MRKHRQYFCRIVVCLILVLSIVPIMTVCANADSNTDIDMNIGDSYVYDGDYIVWKQDGGYYSYNVSTAELNYIGDTYYPRQISGEYDEDGNKVFNATDGDLIIWREADGFYFFDTAIQNMGYYGVTYSGYTDTSNDIGTGISQMDQYSGYDYVIDSYNVQINVNEDNTFDVTEDINVYFNKESHGIYREIPLVNTVHRTDGSVSKNRARVSNVTVSEQSSISQTSDMYRIQIGSENITVTGEKEYKIEYTYDIGADPLKNADEFYFNIIGDSWTSPIGGVAFTIDMPKEFDAGNLGFSAGAAGTVGTDEVEYKVNGNTITGSYKGIIKPGESLTVRLELPEGYFTRNLDVSLFSIISIVLPIVFVLLSFLSVVKKHCLIKTKYNSFKAPYPPQSINSLEAAFWYKGRVNSHDVTSLLFYLANKGYIAVTPIKQGLKKSFKIEKLREYDGINMYEKMFMDGLFMERLGFGLRFGRVAANSNFRVTVSSEDLKDEFYITVNKISGKINCKENLDKVFDIRAKKSAPTVVAYIIITFILAHIAPLKDCFGYMIMDSLLPILLIGVFMLPFIVVFSVITKTIAAQSIILDLFMCGVCYTISFSTIMNSILPLNSVYIISYILSIVCCVLMIILKGKLTKKRSEVGKIAYENIDAFVNFIKNASEREVAQVIRENPNYFSDIYAYASALYPSLKFSKGFKGVRMDIPNWIRGALAFEPHSAGEYNRDFDFDYLNRLLNDINSETHRSMVSSPSSSSDSSGGGDSGGGGGDSGGGSGGGGGGSW